MMDLLDNQYAHHINRNPLSLMDKTQFLYCIWDMDEDYR